MNGTMLEVPQFSKKVSMLTQITTLFFINVVFLAQAEFSYFSADLRLKIFL